MNDAPRTWHSAPSAPTLTLPDGATDCHVHVFGPVARFPYAPESGFKPGDAPKEALFALHDMLGIDRCVIVQSGCHGHDNSVVADAMAALTAIMGDREGGAVSKAKRLFRRKKKEKRKPHMPPEEAWPPRQLRLLAPESF